VPHVKGLLETILIVDDDDTSRRTLEDLLTTSGFRVLIAASSAEARRHISADAPDVVILDSSLLSGVEVLATLRARPALRKAHVLAVSGSDASALALRGFASVTVMRKPFSVDAVVSAVQELLSRKF
jgi:DNA-binding response OmpR family regulator